MITGNFNLILSHRSWTEYRKARREEIRRVWPELYEIIKDKPLNPWSKE